jgi:hypothetical protein
MNDCVDFDSVDLQSIDETTNQLKAANHLKATKIPPSFMTPNQSATNTHSPKQKTT